jgi:hypothetical protein
VLVSVPSLHVKFKAFEVQRCGFGVPDGYAVGDRARQGTPKASGFAEGAAQLMLPEKAGRPPYSPTPLHVGPVSCPEDKTGRTAVRYKRVPPSVHH